MVFCFENTTVDKVVSEYSGIISPNDILVLSQSVAGRVNLPDELKGKSDVLLKLASFSARKQVIIIAAMLAETANRIYDSAVVIDKGRIMGVSDCIFPCGEGLHGGGVSRCYMTSMGRVSVFVGKDVCYPELWSYACASRYIFCLCADKADSKVVLCVRAFALFSGKYVLAAFDGSKISITPYGAIDSIKNGSMSAFYLPMSLANGKKLSKRVRFVREE